jgi:hypothetical protein
MANPDRYSYVPSSSSSSSSSSISSPAGSCHVQPAPIDDVMILLKKYASSMDKTMRKIGILGHTAHLMEEALLQAVVSGSHTGDSDAQGQAQADSDETKLPYIQRLEALLNMTVRDTEGE